MTTPAPVTRAAPRRGRRWFATAALLFFGLSFTGGGVSLIVDALQGADPSVGAHPVRTTATIDDAFDATRRSPIKLIVEYSTQDGTSEVELIEDNTDADPPKKNTSVAVLYDPKDPTQAILASDQSSTWSVWLVGILITLLGAVLLSTGAVRLGRAVRH